MAEGVVEGLVVGVLVMGRLAVVLQVAETDRDALRLREGRVLLAEAVTEVSVRVPLNVPVKVREVVLVGWDRLRVQVPERVLADSDIEKVTVQEVLKVRVGVVDQVCVGESLREAVRVHEADGEAVMGTEAEIVAVKEAEGSE